MGSPLNARLRWYAERARVMPPAEYAHRLHEVAAAGLERTRGVRDLPEPARPPAGWPRPAGAPALVTEREVEAVRALPGAERAARDRADAVLAGRMRFFGYPEAAIGADPDWHRDPVAGRHWPAAHWSRVNHRELGLDPKWIWELGRHQHVVALARAWRLTGDERYAAAATRHLDGFLTQCPPGIGIHWRSGLELGVRLISWAFAVELLRGPALPADLAERLLRSVAGHLDHLVRFPARHSSANNHLIGEAAGRAVGGLCFPEVPGAAGHADAGLAELTAALGDQVLPDGVDAEQAVGYHGFVLELGLAPVACLRRLGRPVPQELSRPLAGIASFLGTLASDGLTLPRIGDEDEGLGVDLTGAADEAERLRFRLRSARALLDADLPRTAPGSDEATIWLCGSEAAERVAGDPERLPGSAVYPHGGYAVLRTRDAPGREVRAVLDAGPMGLPPMAAHGHADLLSLCLSVDGAEVLIDPGTFTYFGEGRWRDYGRSTAAHSTVRVGGREQAEPAGRFLWRTRPAAVMSAAALDGDRLVAAGRHDAYAPVRHERRVELEGRRLTVVDEISGPAGPRELELRWHLAPGSVVGGPAGWRWTDGTRSVDLVIEGAPDQRVVTGDESGPCGFRSKGLERREPSPTIVVRRDAGLPARLVTRVGA